MKKATLQGEVDFTEEEIIFHTNVLEQINTKQAQRLVIEQEKTELKIIQNAAIEKLIAGDAIDENTKLRYAELKETRK
jgi:hypothetical protein